MMQATISAHRLPRFQARLTAGAMYSISVLMSLDSSVNSKPFSRMWHCHQKVIVILKES
ncbi:unnamed protein product [Brassica rapa subsp. narinosa]